MLKEAVRFGRSDNLGMRAFVQPNSDCLSLSDQVIGHLIRRLVLLRQLQDQEIPWYQLIKCGRS